MNQIYLTDLCWNFDLYKRTDEKGGGGEWKKKTRLPMLGSSFFYSVGWNRKIAAFRKIQFVFPPSADWLTVCLPAHFGLLFRLASQTRHFGACLAAKLNFFGTLHALFFVVWQTRLLLLFFISGTVRWCCFCYCWCSNEFLTFFFFSLPGEPVQPVHLLLRWPSKTGRIVYPLPTGICPRHFFPRYILLSE